MGKPFRNLADFGKRMEYWVAGLMIKEGLNVYMPLVDDMGIDMVVRREDGTFVEVQVKARSKNVIMGDAALFSAIRQEQRDNYYFVFYSERLDYDLGRICKGIGANQNGEKHRDSEYLVQWNAQEQRGRGT